MVQWFVTMVIVVVPKTWGCSVGPLANGRTHFMAEINGGDPITTYIHWDDPPGSEHLPRRLVS